MSTIPQFRTVLFAMDLSPSSLLAFHYAAEIAHHFAATLLLTDIVPEEEKALPEYGSVMAKFEEEIGMSVRETEGGELRDIRPNVMIKHTAIGSSLAAVVAQHNADLVVLGTHGRVGIQKVNEGSKAEEIAHVVTVPVLRVGPRVSRAPKFKRLLCVTDFSPTTANAILYAVSFARWYGASLDVLHVNDPGTGESPREAVEGMSNSVQYEIRRHGFDDVFCQEEVLFGESTERILHLAANRNIDMIVMGLRHTSEIRARIAAHLPGGVAHNVIAKAQCAVLTVPDSAKTLPNRRVTGQES
jgi:nucleotide-binding universal stress UspA family protein